MSDVSGVRIHIQGVVQGVGFRYFVFREAKNLGINGYAKNLSTGQVEIVAVAEKGLVDELIKLVRVGPSYASVSGVELEMVETDEQFNEFNIR